MDDVLREHAAVMLQMAKTNRARARALNDEADQLEGLGAELLAVADYVDSSTQPYHPQSTNLNVQAQPVVSTAEAIIVPNGNAEPISEPIPDGGIFHLRVGVNQSELISKAARQAADGKTTKLMYPDGKCITLTPENFDKVAIPHASE